MTPEIIESDSGWPYTKAKTAVLTAAASVLNDQGPRAATLKNIASRAGITEPAIFRHFDGVDGLFSGLYSAFERMYRRFEEAYVSGEKGLPRFRAAILAMADTFASSREYAYILLHAEQVFRGYPELRAKIAELKRNDERLAIDCVAEGQSLGEIRGDVDASTVASSTLGWFSIIALAWVESSFSFDIREECAARWEDTERLISAHPAPRSAEQANRSRSAGIVARSSSAAKRAAKTAAKAAAKTPAKGGAKPVAKNAAKTANAPGRAKSAKASGSAKTAAATRKK